MFPKFVKKSIIVKDFLYFKNRYLEYDKNYYKFILKEKEDELKCFFVLNFENKNNILYIKIIDFYSIKNNFNRELLNLIQYLKTYYTNTNIELIFWNKSNFGKSISNKKIIKTKSIFNIYLIKILKKINNTKLFNKTNFYIGDTDVFINLNKNN